MSDPFAVVSEVIRGRRTINSFESRVPPESVVLAAIELARWAPNHKLTQPWQFHWLGQETIKATIDVSCKMVEAVKGQAAADERRHKWSQVPGWMAVTHQHAGDQFRDHEDYAACCCAIQNFQLALWAQGVGTKWTTGDVTRHPEFLALLGLEPESTEVVGVIWFGYPAQVPTSRRQEVDQILVRHP